MHTELPATTAQLQNPVTPELIRELGALDELRFLMLLLLVALVILAFFGAILWRMVSQQGQQVETSSKNSDKLAVNTDVIEKQNRHLELMVNANERKISLIEANQKTLEGARNDITLLTNQHDSGVLDLKSLVAEKADSTVSTVLEVKTELTEMRDLLTKTIDTLDERDGKVMNTLLAIQKLLEHVLPPEARASIPVTLTGDLTLTPQQGIAVAPPVEGGEPQ